MAKVKRCETCKGQKTILGLGCIRKDCYNCNGTGWVEEDEQALIDAMKERMDTPKPRKKPGRKPKVQQEEVVQCNQPS